MYLNRILLLVLVVLQVGITLPSVPGRIGVFEYLCILSLAVFGVAQQGVGAFIHRGRHPAKIHHSPLVGRSDRP